MDGEILTGAKQNRVVNASILVGARAELKIPVSCVEQGRWRYVAEKFTESRRFSYARLRAQKSAQVAQSLHAFRAFSADQGAIWDEVERKQREMGAESPTGAVNGVYESHEEKLKKYCAAFLPLEGQVGAAVFINGRFVCLDAFDSPASLRRLYPKMIESYALDALEQAGRDKKEPENSAAEQLLEKNRCRRGDALSFRGFGRRPAHKSERAGRLLSGPGRQGDPPGSLCRSGPGDAEEERPAEQAGLEAEGTTVKGVQNG